MKRGWNGRRELKRGWNGRRERKRGWNGRRCDGRKVAVEGRNTPMEKGRDGKVGEDDDLVRIEITNRKEQFQQQRGHTSLATEMAMNAIIDS
jgi:hypothetical protein